MGGKRPDQYQIAPDEAGATDYKTYPNEPGDRNADRDLPHGGNEKPFPEQKDEVEPDPNGNRAQRRAAEKSQN